MTTIRAALPQLALLVETVSGSRVFDGLFDKSITFITPYYPVRPYVSRVLVCTYSVIGSLQAS